VASMRSSHTLYPPLRQSMSCFRRTTTRISRALNHIEIRMVGIYSSTSIRPMMGRATFTHRLMDTIAVPVQLQRYLIRSIILGTNSNRLSLAPLLSFITMVNKHLAVVSESQTEWYGPSMCTPQQFHHHQGPRGKDLVSQFSGAQPTSMNTLSPFPQQQCYVSTNAGFLHGRQDRYPQSAYGSSQTGKS